MRSADGWDPLFTAVCVLTKRMYAFCRWVGSTLHRCLRVDKTHVCVLPMGGIHSSPLGRFRWRCSACTAASVSWCSRASRQRLCGSRSDSQASAAAARIAAAERTARAAAVRALCCSGRAPWCWRRCGRVARRLYPLATPPTSSNSALVWGSLAFAALRTARAMCSPPRLSQRSVRCEGRSR